LHPSLPTGAQPATRSFEPKVAEAVVVHDLGLTDLLVIG
jgi:hypothetical protein